MVAKVAPTHLSVRAADRCDNTRLPPHCRRSASNVGSSSEDRPNSEPLRMRTFDGGLNGWTQSVHLAGHGAEEIPVLALCRARVLPGMR